MDRAERIGFGVAVVGHGALLPALTYGLATWDPPAIPGDPIEVSFVDDVGLVSAAPQRSTEAPAPRAGSESATAALPLPRPAAALPDARPAQTQPQPKQTRSNPTPQQDRRGRNMPDADSFDTTKEGRSSRPPAASVSPQAMASIISAIQRQIQPCADRQPDPGRGASRIRVTLNLRLRPDGSFASRPTLVSGRTTGVDDENRRYVERVGDLILAAASACAPFRGLPEEYYRTPSGGWNNINVNYSLPG